MNKREISASAIESIELHDERISNMYRCVDKEVRSIWSTLRVGWHYTYPSICNTEPVDSLPEGMRAKKEGDGFVAYFLPNVRIYYVGGGYETFRFEKYSDAFEYFDKIKSEINAISLQKPLSE